MQGEIGLLSDFFVSGLHHHSAWLHMARCSVLRFLFGLENDRMSHAEWHASRERVSIQGTKLPPMCFLA